MKKVQLGATLYDVVSMDEYTKNPEYTSKVCIEMDSYVHGKYVLPIKAREDSAVGIKPVPGAMAVPFVMPNCVIQDSQYAASHVIDFDNAENMQELIKADKRVRRIEDEILLTKDSIYYNQPNQNDSPAMKAIKQALNSKHIDLKSYEARIPQYQNTCRLLTQSPTITITKLVEICNALDIVARLTLEDKPDCMNPIGSSITTILNDIGGINDETGSNNSTV